MSESFDGFSSFGLPHFEVSRYATVHFTSNFTPKRVTSGGVHLRGLAPGKHISEETLQRWQAVGDTVSYLTGTGIESKTFRGDNDVFNLYANRTVILQLLELINNDTKHKLI